MKIPSGAAEHALSLNELVHHANRKNKSIIIVTIDFRDAFGSVPHDLINKTMKEIGFDKNFRKMIMDSYNNSSTRICVNGMIGKKYLFRRGVKQGCPLSPTLFNLCIEPLLRKLNKMEDDGYNWKKLIRTAQAYADDLVLVSKSVEGMKNLIRTVEEFCNFAGGMKVNASKCATLAYLWKDGRRVTIDDNLMIQGEEIPTYSLHTAVNYLGLPVATNINAKKKHMFSKLSEMERDTIKVTDSSLDFKYKIDAIKKFILPRIDYEMMAGIAPANALKKLDSLLRGKINEALNTAGLPKEVFYMKINNGGLGLVKLWEREKILEKILQIRSFVGLKDSNDEYIRKLLKYSCKDEISFRKVNIEESSSFLNIPAKTNGSIDGKAKRGTANILSRVVKALFSLNIGLTMNEDEKLMLKDLEDIREEEIKIDSTNCTKTLNKIIERRYASKIGNHNLKGHTFVTLRKSPNSNFFMQHWSNTRDSIVKFAFKARCNALMTGEVNKHKNNVDGNCQLCGQLESLQHICNACIPRRPKYTVRHNEVQKILIDALIEEDRNRIIYNNCTVKGKNGERLTGDVNKLKPDIWWWKDDVLNIMEITIPYGMLSDHDTEVRKSTLEIRRKQKETKYKELVTQCKNQFQCKVNFSVIIVSSLGAIPYDTIKDLRFYFGNKRRLNSLCRRLVTISLRESMFI